ncbi:MAG: flagellar basal body-associated FliL family protein [Caulobacteraceae bacterium]|nr:flagellar basal body-associated FliL family protein [Caulobacter sp.]
MAVAAAISGGATFFLTRPPKEPPAKAKKVAPPEGAAAAAEEEEEPEEEGKKEHPVVNMPAFVVNLGDDLSDQHYLKVSIAVELAGEGEEASKAFEGKAAKARSAVLMYLSTLQSEDVSGAENRKKILEKIGSEVRHAVGGKVARNVYLTELVVQ